MSSVRVYIKPFTMTGAYEASFTEITDYVEKVGDITIDTDSSGFDIGIYRNSGFQLTLNNRDGLFSDVGGPSSMFKYKRGDSIVRVTFDLADYILRTTRATSFQDQFVSGETVLFEGLLNDESLTEDARKEQVAFRVLGFETLFSEKTIFANYVLGDDIEELIYKALNVSRVTDILIISAANIEAGINQVADSIDHLENKSIKQTLDELLLLANSILYIENSTVYVVPREASPALEFTFYGPNALTGVENLQEVKNISNGKNKMFNFFSWQDSTQTAARNASINKYGTRIKELSSELYSNTTKQFNVMESLLDEFGFPKQEMDVQTNLNYSTMDLQILDKVNIDYPLQFVESEGFEFPVCGIAICGESVLPKPILSFSMQPTKYFKIIKRTISPEKRIVTFRIREI